MIKGDIILIPFPFTNLSGTKLRPALILIESSLDITVCFISSQTARSEATDVFVNANPANGLKKDSLIKISKIATLDKSLATGLLGCLTPNELSIVDQSLKVLFKLP